MGWGQDGPGTTLSFVRSFKTSGGDPSTQNMTRKADASRLALAQTLSEAGNEKYNNIIVASRDYVPLIHQIIASCRAYPSGAVLDEKLEFLWTSGVEKVKNSTNKKSKFSSSQALMFEMVMTIVCEGLGHAGTGCDNCIEGKFAVSSKSFKTAAGIFDFLAKVQLPKWVSRGESITENDLPAECSVGVCEALKFLFLGVAQQMAVATVLVKPGTPNYLLVAKLNLGICSLFEDFSRVMRNKTSHSSRFDKNFFTLLTFQVTMHKALSFYFQARDIWAKGEEHGLAIAMLNDASSLMRTRSSPAGVGLPEIDSKSSLKALNQDISDFRKHLTALIKSWEYDNSTIYFSAVPSKVPEDRIIPKGTIMMKPEPYKLDDVSPMLLATPAIIPAIPVESSTNSNPESSTSQSEFVTAPVHSPPPPTMQEFEGSSRSVTTQQRQRSDSDIARELQAQFNAADANASSTNANDLPPPSYSLIAKSLPSETRERSDSELARELQEKLNAGYN